MLKILEKLYPAIGVGLCLAVIAALGLHHEMLKTAEYRLLLHTNIAIWVHVVCGILWIGLLWYFNIVQMPTMPKVPTELRPGIAKFIAPEALFWFRWAALATVASGLLVAYLRGYLVRALTFQDQLTIGIGMWLALIMAFNVWVIIWPNQKKALGLVPAESDERARAARIAMLTSRANFVLSMPMLYCMVSQNIVG
jgi:uncharacterized membrane protein